jgi:hypothetical protein
MFLLEALFCCHHRSNPCVLGRLPAETTAGHLKALFEHFGFVTHAEIKETWNESAKAYDPKNLFARITFLDIERANLAKAHACSNGIYLEDVKLLINYWKKQVSVSAEYDCHICKESANHTTLDCPLKSQKAFCMHCRALGHFTFECSKKTGSAANSKSK